MNSGGSQDPVRPSVKSDADSAISLKSTPSIDTINTKVNSKRNSRVLAERDPSPTQIHSVYHQVDSHLLTAEEHAAQTQENQQAITQAATSIVPDVTTFPSNANNSPQDDDTFSDGGYESDSLLSASTSMTSSVRNFTYENGRRYHRFREGVYNFPNDDVEQDREDMKHAMVMNLCQQLHFAPIGDNPQRILDMGTGTGIWAIEMGEKYESATVLGVDLSPIQPTWVPPNVRFTVDDVESPWLHPRDHFDFIHSRHTVMAFKNWPKLLKNVYDHLQPGGWYEAQEIHHFPQCHDNTLPSDHPVSEYWNNISLGLSNLGVDFTKTLQLSRLVREAGFINVTERIFHVPIGMWPKNKVLKGVGLFWRTILMDGLMPIAIGPMTRGLGWKKEEVEEWCEVVKGAYMDGWVHSHMPLHIIYAQKPYEKD